MLRIITPDATELKISPSEEALSTGDVEYVVGRRQVASLGFVVMVLLALCSGVSYVAGRAVTVESTPKVSAPAPTPTPVAYAPVAEPAPVPVQAQPAHVQAPVTASPATSIAKPADLDPAIAGMAIPGQRYVQVGAVERAVAVLMVESLRAKGLKGFAAAGPTSNVYRVLVGPLPSDDEYTQAKATIDGMGIPTFTRQ